MGFLCRYLMLHHSPLPNPGSCAAVYLTSDMVIAATKDTMEDTIAYIDDKYGGCANYLHEVRLGLLVGAFLHPCES